MEYIAFGEVLFEEHSSSFSSPYLFNGKELDRETNLSYYGARYYDIWGSFWCGVDSKAEKMPNYGAYVYAFNNPVRFIDPDGNIPTPYEAALMSAHVYGDSKVKLAGGWKVSNAGRQGKGVIMKDDKTGFKSVLYQRTVKGKTEYTYATAGTEDMLDTKHDIKQVFGLSEQYNTSTDNAKQLKINLKGAEITFTGHSLGGGLAEANANETGMNAITFNAAGLSVFSPGGLKKTTTTDAYILTTDPLNALQGATGLPSAGGRKHFIKPGSTQGGANGHSINSMIEAFETKSFGEFVKNSVETWFNSYNEKK